MRRNGIAAACALLLALLLPVCSLAQTVEGELDEETLARMDQATEAAPAATDLPEQVYAISDVLSKEKEELIVEPLRPDFVQNVLDVARGELGYTEGANNYSKYGTWAGEPNAAWCAEFVGWCVNRADALNGTKLLDVVYPNYSGQNTGRDWVIKRGRFVYRKGNCPDWGYQWLLGDTGLLTKNGYIPRSGDLVFFSYNDAGDTEHVALVEYCATDEQGRVVIHVIEGNNPSCVQRNSYLLNNSQVLGFGVCEDVVGTTMRSGNRGDKVLKLQQALNKLGLLEERHLTGAYGGNTKRAVMTFQSEHMENQAATGVADRQTQQAIEAELSAVAYDTPDTWLVED
ncbi:MAG: peptidoglycan-binding protein [Clostridia bacterium]